MVMSDGKWPPSSSSAPSTAVDVTFTRLAPRSSTSSARAGSGSSDHGSSSHSHSRGDESSSRLDDTPQKNNTTISARSRLPTSRSMMGGGFLLRTPNSSKLDRKRGHDRKEKVQVQKEQPPGDRGSLRVPLLSEESSLRSSPLTRELSSDYSTIAEDAPVSNSSPRMDPAQLVRMALDLSESRKRNLSGSLHVPLPAATARGFSGGQKYGSLPSRSNNTRASGHRDDGLRSSTMSTDSSHLHHVPQPYPDADMDLTYDFSPATLSRAEKARKYFELASEYRKLLRHLPPINPQATEIDQHLNRERAYNPLQTLRNRRLRTREKRPYTAPVEAWQELDTVKNWVTDVEDSGKFEMTVDDAVDLPLYPGDGILNGDVQGTTVTGHRRTNTVSSTIMRPENGWTVDPAEILADTYWTEQSDNKLLLEDRRGDRVFPPRQSVERPSRAIDDEEDGERTKRRMRGQTLLHNPFPRTSRSSSTASLSSVDAAAEDNRDENIGPLERHMEQLIHLEERGELSSPDTTSSDKWDSRHVPFREDIKNQHDNLLTIANETSLPGRFHHQRAKSADGRVGSIDQTVDGLNSDDPSSPVVPGIVPSMSIDLSTLERGKSPIRQHKSRFHGLGKFRAHSKEHNKIESTDFASNVPTVNQPRASFESSRQPIQRHKPTQSLTGSLRRNESNTTKTRSSFESSQPSFQRHRPTESWNGSLRRQDTHGDGSIKEHGSSVGRFFKGGRIGDLVRSEGSRLVDRMGGKDDGSDRWEEDNDAPNGVASGDSDPSPRTSLDRGRTRARYNIPALPSFKSPAVFKGEQNNTDPISRQQQAQRETAKPARFEKLAPPPIYPPHGGDSKIYSQPSSRDSLASLDNVGPMSFKRNERPALGERRHWSISDNRQSESGTKVTMQDVERVKALLLSSGIKAREIERSADKPRDQPLLYLKKVSRLVGKQLHAPSRRQEHQIAARALSEDLASTLSEFEQTLNRFQGGTARSLASELDDLQHKATDQLTKLVHETSDDADAFTVELTTKQPQDIKRIDDAIDDMLRRRRRQFRVLRRTGFKLLEWMVLGIMWWIWFIVVLINTAKKIVLGLIHFVYWLVRF